MSKSFKDMVQPDGVPRENFGNGESIETPGDVSEVLQKLYGMIWFLAMNYAAAYSSRKVASRDAILVAIKLAEDNAYVGLERGTSGE